MKVNVTRSFLPDFDSYIEKIKTIWETNQLTNQGPLTQELEQSLAKYLGVQYLSLQANGTLSLQLAIRALKLSGEIITTPFSYVATTNSILWENCTPVFADIDPKTCCIDPVAIEALITPKTTAIMATHVYGIPCDADVITQIASKHGLKVIYDAAHAFGVEYKGESILRKGDISTLSFHSTKLFHTIEGGATICNNEALLNELNLLRSFGHRGDVYYGLGINAKMSEFHAAMGLCVLPHVGEITASRKQVVEKYRSLLGKDAVIYPEIPDYVTRYNYSYFPVIFQSAAQREKVQEVLGAEDIFPRRYFYPSLNTLPHHQGRPCPVSEDLAQKVLSLPLYAGMDDETVEKVSKLVLKGCSI